MLSVKPWKPEAVLFLFGGVFLCVLAGTIFSSVVHPKAAAADELSFGSFVIGLLGFQGSALVLTAFFVKKHRLTWREAFGFANHWKKSVLLGWFLAAIFLPVAYAMQALSGYVLLHFSHVPVEQETVKVLQTMNNHAEEAVMMVVVVFIVPLIEEILFRGILYPLVKQNGFPRLAWWGVSLFFAAMHFNAVSFVPLLVLALLLTFLYERTNNLLAPIAAHSLFNAYAFVQLYLMAHG